MTTITIPYRFTSLNEYISAERTNRHIAANIKKRETEAARLAAIDAVPVRYYPVCVRCHWYKSDGRSDPDNIAFAIKFILDGFVEAGILVNDGWKQIRNIQHTFNKSSKDYVVIELVDMSY